MIVFNSHPRHRFCKLKISDFDRSWKWKCISNNEETYLSKLVPSTSKLGTFSGRNSSTLAHQAPNGNRHFGTFAASPSIALWRNRIWLEILPYYSTHRIDSTDEHHSISPKRWTLARLFLHEDLDWTLLWPRDGKEITSWYVLTQVS